MVRATPKFDIEDLLDNLADRITAKLHERQSGGCTAAPQRLFTVEQAAKYLGRTQVSVQHMVAARKLPVVRDGRRVFLDVQALDRWIEQRTEAAEI